jgi:peptidoglycan/LPS O-acetylase OafA/YrhL
MDNLIVALFGVNRFNLWGWVVGGLSVIGLAIYLVVGALVPTAGPGFSPEVSLLLAACLLLLGIFCVLLQMYCALLALKFELTAGRQSAGDTNPWADRGHAQQGRAPEPLIGREQNG